MAKINTNYKKLQGSYLFSEVAKRIKEFKREHPDVIVYNMGIGNTTQPLARSVVDSLQKAAKNLGLAATYTGYGDEQGNTRLRDAICKFYLREYKVKLTSDEVFISDGAKSDLGNMLSVFDSTSIVAIQDPVYPAYVDSSVISGFSGDFQNGTYQRIAYMSCSEDNNFFPKIPSKKVDIIYLCSPNNPTGVVVTNNLLKAFVDYARSQKAIIIFDAAYSCFIQEESLPRSIYQIPGAKECAIEINSFSKYAGFTGVRLGWTVVPNNLVIEGTSSGEIRALWNRRQTTMFNGASNIAQAGGIAALSEKGQRECREIINYYLANTKIIKNCFERLGFFTVGGENAPYVWVKTPKNMSSWEFFDELLKKAHIVVTPGVGFGPSGEGYVRLSGFGNQDTTRKAVQNIQNYLRI